MYLLTGTHANGDQFRLGLLSGKVAVGRNQDCSICLDEESVSRLHAEFFIDDGQLRLKDLGSKNGTRVNGEVISQIDIILPCRVAFGKVECDIYFVADDIASVDKSQVEEIPADLLADVKWPLGASNRLEDVDANFEKRRSRLWKCLAWSLGIFMASISLWTVNHLRARSVVLSAKPSFIARKGVSVPVSPVEVQQAQAVVDPSAPAKGEEGLACRFAIGFMDSVKNLSDSTFGEMLEERSWIAVEGGQPSSPPRLASPPLLASAVVATDRLAYLDLLLSAQIDRELFHPSNALSFLGKPTWDRGGKFQLTTSELVQEGPSRQGVKALGPSISQAKWKVLFIGDSMSLCGFGKCLDKLIRTNPQVSEVYTYMACGTVPLSWLKDPPYTNIKTPCGFWSIETEEGKPHPKEYLETYGMKRGDRPKPHLVPKLEDLLTKWKPDILVIQSGTNLFSLFRSGQSLIPDRHGPMLKNQIAPFMHKLLSLNSTLRKIYWVGSPISGRVSPEIQEFVLSQVQKEVGYAATVIDSREMVPYPYRHMAKDREHFAGAQMDDWANQVFGQILADLAVPLALHLPPAKEVQSAVLKGSSPTDEVSVSGDLVLKVKLVFKSPPLPTAKILPYQESLVGLVYAVEKVIKGQYGEKQILVMHPAHIRLKPQSLEKYRLAKSYTMRLRELEGSPWGTIKSSDTSGLIDLIPYIQIEDEAKSTSPQR
ncbi:MAG: FHA domain-containing protein [Verrucomicrobiota bacterium]